MIVKKISKFTLLIALIGFGVSLYALILHIKNLLSPGGGAFCDVSATINCTSVIGSRFGEFASIPLGAYGMAYFAILFAALLTPKFATITKKQLATLELIIALLGVVVVGILMIISYGILKLVCPTCSVIHALVVLYTVLKLYQFFKARKEEASTQLEKPSMNDALTRFFAMAICFSIPPLMIGLMTPFIVSYIGNKSSNTPTSTQQFTRKIEKKMQVDLRSFNKTNYVGDGEDYRRGNDHAPVIVQIFSDFGCPHCKTANEALIKAQDIVGEDKVLLVYRFYPLSNECNQFIAGKGFYQYNCSLIVAARCAGQQGKFWPFKEWAFSGQEWTTQERDKNFSPEGLKSAAEKFDMNVKEFSECLKSDSESQKIKNDIILANQLNIQGTPMIIINGKEYQGPLEADIFVKEFEKALQ